MITLIPYRFDINECDRQLRELQDFLTTNQEIKEGGENGLQKFFSFIQQSGLIQRFRWRSSKTIINSKSLHCMTFDQLLEESMEKLSTLKLK